MENTIEKISDPDMESIIGLRTLCLLVLTIGLLLIYFCGTTSRFLLFIEAILTTVGIIGSSFMTFIEIQIKSSINVNNL